MKTNTILQGEALEQLKKLPEKSINMCMTSPPYWALRDYGTAEWIGGSSECNHKIKNNISEFKGDWNRPSRKEFNNIGELLKCVVCGNEFKGKIGNKFCSTKCLNTLSNDERTNAVSEKIDVCSRCGAKRKDLQLGLEPTFNEYIIKLCDIFDEVKRVLRDDGTCWVNIGDSYMGSGKAGNNPDYQKKHTSFGNVMKKGSYGVPTKIKGMSAKCLAMIPMRFAIEMVNRGWILRNTIIWHKPNCMPSSVKDRFTIDFEYIFFFSKKKKYYFEQQLEPSQYKDSKGNVSDKARLQRANAGWKPGKDYPVQANVPQAIDNVGDRYCPAMRNKRAVWKIKPKPFKEAHFAVYPEELCETPIKAGCSKGGIVLDPFFGSGTTGLVALKQEKKFIGCELNPEYIKIAEARLKPFMVQERLI